MATTQYISYSARGGSGGGGGVSSINSLTGAITLAAGSGITITPAGNTLTIAATNAGVVTSVTASSPLFSSGGATPNLTIQQSGAAQDGYLSSTDWNTFNNKQPALGFTPENAANKGIAGGYASLDGGGKVPFSQLPSALMTYLGNWDASTNTPTLADGTGDVGDVYRVSVAGTQNLGSGPITFFVGDFIIYNGTVWQRSPAADGVVSVNGFTGAVVLTTTDINEGTNLYFTGERAQDAVGTILVNTDSIDLIYSDATPSISANVNVDPDGPVIINPNGLSVNVANGIDISAPGIDAATSVLLHFDNNLTDSSTYAFTVVQDGATAASYVPGEFSQALDFTAANTGFSIADAPELQFGAGDFTVECWLMPTISGDVTDHQFLNKSNGTNTDWAFLYNSDRLQFGIPSLGFLTPFVSVSIEDGNWHHVAFVRNGTTTFMFLDGNIINTSSVSGSITAFAGSDLGIGHYKTNFSSQYFGLMDEVRISKGVARWTANFTPPVLPYTDTLPVSIELEAIANNTVLANKSGGTATPVATALSSVVETGSSVLTITNGANSVVAAANLTIQVSQSTTSTSGYLSSTDWNTFNGKQAAGNYITALTGDGTATGPGSVAFTLSTVNSNVGSFGSASSVGTFTVNAKGLITAAADVSIQIAESQVTNLVSDLAGKQPTGNYITALTGDATASGPGSVALTLATVNGNVGSFGSSTAIPSFTVNAKGLITAASTNVVIAPAGTLTGTTLAANVVSSSLTSLGTITTGVWNGTTIAIANGGTGATTQSTAFDALSPMTTGGDLIYGGASGTGTRLANGTAGQMLQSNGGTAAPSWVTSGTVGSTTLDSGYTPIAAWGTATNVSVWYKIVGDEMHVRGTFKSGTVTAATAALVLPASKTIDSAKMTSLTNTQQVGFMSMMQNGARNVFSATNANAVLFYDGSTTDRIFVALSAGGTANQFTKVNASVFMSNNDSIAFDFWVPIT